MNTNNTMNMSSSNTGNEGQKSSSSKKNVPENVLIIESDMDNDMQIAALEIARKYYPFTSMTNFEIAQQLKDTFESKYYPTWNCIVGTGFGCKINAQKNHYLCFQIENRTVILYKFRQKDYKNNIF